MNIFTIITAWIRILGYKGIRSVRVFDKTVVDNMRKIFQLARSVSKKKSMLNMLTTFSTVAGWNILKKDLYFYPIARGSTDFIQYYHVSTEYSYNEEENRFRVDDDLVISVIPPDGLEDDNLPDVGNAYNDLDPYTTFIALKSDISELIKYCGFDAQKSIRRTNMLSKGKFYTVYIVNAYLYLMIHAMLSSVSKSKDIIPLANPVGDAAEATNVIKGATGAVDNMGIPILPSGKGSGGKIPKPSKISKLQKLNYCAGIPHPIGKAGCYVVSFAVGIFVTAAAFDWVEEINPLSKRFWFKEENLDQFVEDLTASRVTAIQTRIMLETRQDWLTIARNLNLASKVKVLDQSVINYLSKILDKDLSKIEAGEVYKAINKKLISYETKLSSASLILAYLDKVIKGKAKVTDKEKISSLKGTPLYDRVLKDSLDLNIKNAKDAARIMMADLNSEQADLAELMSLLGVFAIDADTTGTQLQDLSDKYKLMPKIHDASNPLHTEYKKRSGKQPSQRSDLDIPEEKTADKIKYLYDENINSTKKSHKENCFKWENKQGTISTTTKTNFSTVVDPESKTVKHDRTDDYVITKKKTKAKSSNAETKTRVEEGTRNKTIGNSDFFDQLRKSQKDDVKKDAAPTPQPYSWEINGNGSGEVDLSLNFNFNELR